MKNTNKNTLYIITEISSLYFCVNEVNLGAFMTSTLKNTHHAKLQNEYMYYKVLY